MIFNLMGRFFDIQVVVWDRLSLAVRGGSFQDFLFCKFRVNQVVMFDTVIPYDNYLKLFRTALDTL